MDRSSSIARSGTVVGGAVARCVCLAVLATLSIEPRAFASGHGPVFGLTTPTNAAGGWTVDFGAMGRSGTTDQQAAVRTMVSYGVTEDLQLSASVPLVLSSAPVAVARMSSMMPGGGDIEGLVAWRFHRQGTRVGTRLESTAYAGVLMPGPQRPAGLPRSFARAPGLYTAVATGLASRSHYLWGGLGYTRFAERGGDRRSPLLSYSLVWGYRPEAWRKDYPHWDWRLFAEMTGERSSGIRSRFAAVPGTTSHQVFVGPTTLGIYKNYAIEGGVQVPVYRRLGARLQRDAFRYGVNLSYFF